MMLRPQDYVTLFDGGGYIFHLCPNCRGAFTVSLEVAAEGKICNPAWCVTKKEPHDIKRADKILKAARKMKG